MRMLYKFSLLNIISCCIFCTAAFCDCTNLGSNHQCAAGTYWTGMACETCPSGRYCPGNGMAYCCPEPFTETLIFDNVGNIIDNTGAKSAKSCFIKISKCGTTTLDTPLYITCKNEQWEHTNTESPRCIEPAEPYEVQQSLNNDHNCSYAKKAYYWHDIYLGLAPISSLTPADPFAFVNIIDIDNHASNHLEAVPLYNDCPRYEQHAWLNHSFELKCFPNTVECSFLVNNINDDIAANSNIQTCENGIVTGNAYWLSKDNPENNLGYDHWDVSGCQCQYNGNLLNQDAHCYGNGTYNAIFNNTSTDNVNTVHTVGEHIIFDTEHSSDFVCTKCQEGAYYVPGNDNVVIVTGCEPVTGYGAWREPKNTGYCNDENNNGATWTYPLNGNPCKLRNCSAGKTTNVLGPIGSDSCHYSHQTKFCDAKGCFQINQADFNDWEF